MILIEWLRAAVWYVCRFFVWFFTGRDCKHCKNSRKWLWFDGCFCVLSDDEEEKCLRGLHRPLFERDKEERS